MEEVLAKKVLENHRLGKETKVSELAFLLSTNRNTVIKLVDTLNSSCFSKMGYALVFLSRRSAKDSLYVTRSSLPPSPSPASPSYSSDSLRVIKRNISTDQSINFMIIVFSILYFEGGEVSEEGVLECIARLKQLGMVLNNQLKEMVGRKYLKKVARYEKVFYTYGWKYFVEFNGFKPSFLEEDGLEAPL